MVAMYTPCILFLKRNLTDATQPGYTRSTVLKKGALLRFQEAARSALDVRLSEGGILNAAVEIFAERGFSTTRVEDILERAGVARRTFYKYFSSKEAVLAAIYELATGELIAGMQAASAGAEADPLEAIQLGLDAYLDYHLAHGPLLRVLVQQAVRSDSPLAPLRARFREGLVQLLDTAVRASGRPAQDPVFYRALISAVEGVSLELLTTESGPKDVERAKAALHLLLEKTLRS